MEAFALVFTLLGAPLTAQPQGPVQWVSAYATPLDWQGIFVPGVPVVFVADTRGDGTAREALGRHLVEAKRSGVTLLAIDPSIPDGDRLITAAMRAGLQAIPLNSGDAAIVDQIAQKVRTPPGHRIVVLLEGSGASVTAIPARLEALHQIKSVSFAFATKGAQDPLIASVYTAASGIRSETAILAPRQEAGYDGFLYLP